MTAALSPGLFTAPIMIVWRRRDSCHDRGAGGGCLWSQCSLTDHLLITRDWAPVSSAQSSLDALRPRLLRSDRACRFWSLHTAQAWHWDWRQNKLDFSSFGETEQSSSPVSHQCDAHVTKTDSAGHRDIWSHLSSWEWRMKGGYCQQSFYHNRHRQSINL